MPEWEGDLDFSFQKNHKAKTSHSRLQTWRGSEEILQKTTEEEPPSVEPGCFLSQLVLNTRVEYKNPLVQKNLLSQKQSED